MKGLINKVSVPSLQVDCASPVTIIRTDLCRLVRDLSEPVENEPENFQGVTRDGLHILGLTKIEISVGSLRVKHPVLIADEIAHKFILGIDFLTDHKCDILNSRKVILFGNKRVLYILFRLTVNYICPVVCTVGTTIDHNEKAIFPALLDAAQNYAPGDTVLIQARNDLSDNPLLGARVLVSCRSPVVPLLFVNLSARSVTNFKSKILADDSKASTVGFENSNIQPVCSNKSRTVVSAFKQSEAAKVLTTVQQAMANADPALSFINALLSKNCY